jgi:hypothetical protein
VAWSLLILGASYLLIIFPVAYFRHDDWLILGNAALKLPTDWMFAFRPTLFYGEEEVVWFFRPFFKLGVLVWYRLFGFRYYLWLSALLLMLVASVVLGAMTLRLLSSSRRATLFTIVFCASVYFHFGSLVWMGEGMMNCPQLFLLALTSYLFVASAQQPRVFDWRSALALGVFILSLGFKESGVFHVGFLCALLWSGNLGAGESWLRKAARLAPYVAVSVIYLAVRMGMPMNPGYAPQLKLLFFIKPLIILAAGPFFVVAVTYLFVPGAAKLRGLIAQFRGPGVFYLLFLVVSVLPYFGHGFFSVGWLLLPGFYFCFIFALLDPSLENPGAVKQYAKIGWVLLLLSVTPVLWRLDRVGWWQWHRPQRQLEAMIENASAAKIRQAFVLNCPNDQYPKVTLNEVVGFDAGFYFLWAMHKPSPIPFHVVPCDALETESSRFAHDESDLIIRWKFPEFTLVSGASSRLAERATRRTLR